ncbi:hypothetical protein SAMN05421678_105243 [Actinopolymorpha cephalotaxi]|uniref:Uncharacterized protein n=1 Tax=Actinopolymorpha cephalotaxi TaxID=504797 RepID=A0A1I2RDD0_9ACTN|nr:hypothetical protein [Actinopolymorpha cephalotaxi]NYH82351.1 hypothetical protein [Actinopolymorpha cephalotaxi]SFG35796.1 hypothetical protein SAMN05421678_105243 [Actinopolymorpha cephalotaxi]
MSAPIDGYVRRVRHLLPGPAAARSELMCELSDGLYDAARAHVRAGVAAEEAGARAVADCGPAEDTAAAYRPELTAVQGRHTAMLVAVLMPGLNLLWDVPWMISGPWNAPPNPVVSALSRVVTGSDLLAGGSAVVLLLLMVLAARRGRPATSLTGAVAVVGVLAFTVTLGCSVAMMAVNADGPSQAFATSWIGLLVGSVTLGCACLLVRSLVRSLRSAFAGVRTP